LALAVPSTRRSRRWLIPAGCLMAALAGGGLALFWPDGSTDSGVPAVAVPVSAATPSTSAAPVTSRPPEATTTTAVASTTVAPETTAVAPTNPYGDAVGAAPSSAVGLLVTQLAGRADPATFAAPGSPVSLVSTWWRLAGAAPTAVVASDRGYVLQDGTGVEIVDVVVDGNSGLITDYTECIGGVCDLPVSALVTLECLPGACANRTSDPVGRAQFDLVSFMAPRAPYTVLVFSWVPEGTQVVNVSDEAGQAVFDAASGLVFVTYAGSPPPSSVHTVTYANGSIGQLRVVNG
jgi:hypothetical protein